MPKMKNTNLDLTPGQGFQNFQAKRTTTSVSLKTRQRRLMLQAAGVKKLEDYAPSLGVRQLSAEEMQREYGPKQVAKLLKQAQRNARTNDPAAVIQTERER